jgi:predicted membrane-bound mannosyltransferase
MIAALLAAANTIKDEPSKTPFYVLAGLLVLAAIGLAAVGIRRHESFPDSDGAMRATIALFVLLVAGTMITAVATS